MKKKNDGAEDVSDLNWERKLIEDLLVSAADVNKKRLRIRRITLSLRLLTFLMIASFLVFTLVDPRINNDKDEIHTAYVDINGEIAKGSQSDADSIIPSLKNAFENENSKAVIIRINSPGGSPVQSNQIYKEIRRLKAKHDKKAYAVIDDMGASGGYFIAASADEIYADRSSIVGSIGVISASFGFSGLMEKLGVERRILVSGSNKSMLDPYSPVSKGAEKQWQTILKSTHSHFIDSVREGRTGRLDETNKDLFSGYVWSGSQSLELGLIDGFGSLQSVASDIIGAEVTVDYSPRKNIFGSLAHKVSALFNYITIQ